MRWSGVVGESSVLFLDVNSFWGCLLMCFSVLCGELAVKLVNEPFITATDDKDEWAV